MTESTIDFPKESLCPEIWDKVVSIDGMTDTWKMRKDVKAHIIGFITLLLSIANLPMPKTIHITGSITSNSYTKNADIDIHFLGFEDVNLTEDLIQEQLKNAVAELKQLNAKTSIGTHPFEVYYLTNAFLDYMSIGCYDLIEDYWEVGPELTDIAFNPYSEYYNDILKASNGIIELIRNMIFSIYEITIIYKKNINTEFGNNIRTILLDKLSSVQSLYDTIRNSRKVYSSPTSRELALKFRSSRKWKIADSAFKLFDKYGYTAILKEFIKIYDIMKNSDGLDDEIVTSILDTVKKYINNADKLSEKEMTNDVDETENIDEDANSMLTILSIAGMLAIPGLIPLNALAAELKNVPRQELRMKSPAVTKAINNVAAVKKSFNGLSYANTTNLIATTAYNEVGTDYVKYKDKRIVYAVGNSMLTRAGGQLDYIPKEILRSGQYYGAAKHVIGYSKLLSSPVDANYTMYDPRTEGGMSKSQEEAWKLCNEMAVMLLNGTLPNVIGDRMMLSNKKIDNPDDYEGWGQYCDMKLGSQYWGYDRVWDGYRRYNTKKPADLNHTPTTQNIYIVKAGDTGYAIAKAHNMKFTDLKKKNSKIDLDHIKPGQKLFV